MRLPTILMLACLGAPAANAAEPYEAATMEADTDIVAVVRAQRLDVVIDPAGGEIAVAAELQISRPGPLDLRLTAHADIGRVALNGAEIEHARPEPAMLHVEATAAGALTLRYTATLQEDVAAGERPGQIHNFAVQAHVGENGIFLSDGSAWHPRPMGRDGHPQLHEITANVNPLEGWAIVASGEPQTDDGPEMPCWRWATPRDADGMAIVGNRHVTRVRRYESALQQVDIVMQCSEARLDKADMFLDAAVTYLQMYEPLLGPLPYRRFTIVENFFSSGFAFPGFTVLGPQVVGMAPRSLAPGYLDHELVHNWWGNGVYVDPGDGNWCEALTSFCSNYFRRVFEDGPEAGTAYRRGILMKLSTDPDGLDDGPLRGFGSADPSGGGPDRFVGYDKGAFVFAMLTDVVGGPEPMFETLRRFSAAHLGRRAGWADLQAALESAKPELPAGWLDGFFDTWVDTHFIPRTIVPDADDPSMAFALQFVDAGVQTVDVRYAADGTWLEIDPDFRLYRVLPPEQIVPTIAGTLGLGGVAAIVEGDAASGLVATLDVDESGENLLLIGAGPVQRHATLIERTQDPIETAPGQFTVGGTTYDHPDQSVLHTMPHPDRPGRFITVFHGNGSAGWARLRLIRFYTRDTTVIWHGDAVIERRTFEPSRRLRVP